MRNLEIYGATPVWSANRTFPRHDTGASSRDGRSSSRQRRATEFPSYGFPDRCISRCIAPPNNNLYRVHSHTISRTALEYPQKARKVNLLTRIHASM